MQVHADPDRIVRAGLCLLLACAPLVVSPFHHDAANLPQGALIQVGTALLLAIWCAGGWRREQQRLPSSPLNAPVLALLGWSLASAGWAVNRTEAWRGGRSLIACGIAYLLALATVRTSRDARLLLGSSFAAGVLVALIGLAQRFAGLSWIPQAFPPAATFVQKNVAAEYVVLVLPLGLALVAGGASRRRIALVCAGAVSIALYLLAARTRSAYVAAGVEAIALLLLRGRVFGPGTADARVATLVAVLAGATPSLAAVPDAGTSVETRLAIWSNTLRMIGDQPVVGVGLGNHAVVYPLYAQASRRDPMFEAGRQLDFAHNDYLQLWSELGSVGLALAAWLGIAALRVARRALTRHEALAGVLSLTGFAAHACFGFPLERALPPLVVAVILGALAGLTGEPRLPARGLAVPRRRLALAAALVWCGAASRDAVAALRVDAGVLRMMRADGSGDFALVLRESEWLRAREPRRREVLFLAGKAYLTLGRAPEAIAPLSELVKSYPYDRNALGNLGLAHAQARQHQAALDSFQRVLRIQPREAAAHFQSGVALQGLRRPRDAWLSFREAARLEPANADYEFRAGLAAASAREFEAALSHLRRAQELDPTSASVHKALGVILIEGLGRGAEGRPHIERALALAPGDRDAGRLRALLDGAAR